MDLEKLRELLGKFSDIQLAYLFGSYAEERSMPASDLDLAILTRRRGTIPQLMAEISNSLGIPEEKIMILDIQDAPPSLKLKILKGINLLDRGGYAQKLIREMDPEILDVIENQKSDFLLWLESDPLDESLLKRILAQLSEDFEDLRDLLGRGEEEIMHDRYLRKAFERTLQTSIEGILDLLRHIISGLNLGIAEYYRDYVEIARNRGVITDEIADRLLELIPLRHGLVHTYREIDHHRLWNQAEILAETMPRLREELRNYLRKRGRDLGVGRYRLESS